MNRFLGMMLLAAAIATVAGCQTPPQSTMSLTMGDSKDGESDRMSLTTVRDTVNTGAIETESVTYDEDGKLARVPVKIIGYGRGTQPGAASVMDRDGIYLGTAQLSAYANIPGLGNLVSPSNIDIAEVLIYARNDDGSMALDPTTGEPVPWAKLTNLRSNKSDVIAEYNAAYDTFADMLKHMTTEEVSAWLETNKAWISGLSDTAKHALNAVMSALFPTSALAVPTTTPPVNMPTVPEPEPSEPG